MIVLLFFVWDCASFPPWLHVAGVWGTETVVQHLLNLLLRRLIRRCSSAYVVKQSKVAAPEIICNFPKHSFTQAEPRKYSRCSLDCCRWLLLSLSTQQFLFVWTTKCNTTNVFLERLSGKSALLIPVWIIVKPQPFVESRIVSALSSERHGSTSFCMTLLHICYFC